MPTDAQVSLDNANRQTQQNLMQMALQQKLAQSAAAASMYGADKGFQGQQYAADTNLRAQEGTNATHLAGLDKTTSSARDIAGINNQAALMDAATNRDKYLNSTDRMFAMMLNGGDASGGGSLPQYGGGSTSAAPMPQYGGGSSFTPGATPGAPTPAGASNTVKSTKPGAATRGPRESFDMTGFAKDTADIEARINADRTKGAYDTDSSGAKFGRPIPEDKPKFGPNGTFSALESFNDIYKKQFPEGANSTANTFNAIVDSTTHVPAPTGPDLGQPGNPVNLNRYWDPAKSSSSTATRAQMAEKLKQQITQDALSKAAPNLAPTLTQPGQSGAAPVAQPPATQAPGGIAGMDEGKRQLLIAAGKLKPTAAEEDARSLKQGNIRSLFETLNNPATPAAARVRAAADMKRLDPSFDDSRYAMLPAEQDQAKIATAERAATMQKVSSPQGVLNQAIDANGTTISDSIADLESKIRSPLLFMGNKEGRDITQAARAIKAKIMAAPGGVDNWEQIKSDLVKRMFAAEGQAGLFSGMQNRLPWGPAGSMGEIGRQAALRGLE